MRDARAKKEKFRKFGLGIFSKIISIIYFAEIICYGQNNRFT